MLPLHVVWRPTTPHTPSPQPTLHPTSQGTFPASFPVFIKVLKFVRDMGYVIMCAQSSPSLSWGDSPVIFSDAAIEKYVTEGWMTGNIWIALAREGVPLPPLSDQGK